jgi:beta-galactosidase
VPKDHPELADPVEAGGEGRADSLELKGATALASYDHPHFGQFPAVTSHPFGKGRVTYIGTLPNAPMAEAVASWVLRESGIEPLVADPPASVRVNTAQSAAGDRLWFLSNWSGPPVTIPAVPVGGKELFTGNRLESDSALELGPWDVKIVVEG